MKNKEKLDNAFSCLLSILDTIKLHDKGILYEEDETLSQMMFRKMSAYKIDLNKELNFDHLEPVTVEQRDKNRRFLDDEKSLEFSKSLFHWIHKEGYVIKASKNGDISWSKDGKSYDFRDLHNIYIDKIDA